MTTASKADLRFSRNNLDLIRLVAAADVAIKHGMSHLEVGKSASEWLGLFPGVPIFFFVSGFLIYRSYQNAPTLRVFAMNRVLRLYPALLVCFLLSVGLVLMVGFIPPSRLVSSDFLIWAIAQTSIGQFYNWEVLRGFGAGVINGSLWTISVELQFYLLTPIIFACCHQSARRLLAAAVLFSIFNIAFLATSPETTTGKLFMVSFLPWLYMFLAGAYISTKARFLQKIVSMKWTALIALYVAGLIGSHILGLPYLGNYVSPLIFVPVCLIIVKLAFTAPGCSERLLRRNDISYGLYIYHMPVINLLLYFGLKGRTEWLVVAMVAAVLLATASWFAIERPALKLKRASLRGASLHP